MTADSDLSKTRQEITREKKESNRVLQVRLRSITLGNTAIDGEIIGDGWKMALEIKTPKDDAARGLG